MYFYLVIGILLIYGAIVTYFCMKFALTVLKIQDSLQNSLNTIDEKYESISEILSRPLFYDSPEVRRVLKDIEATRDALEDVANDLAGKIENETLEENELNEG